jgi:hypothetical protein
VTRKLSVSLCVFRAASPELTPLEIIVKPLAGVFLNLFQILEFSRLKFHESK